MLPFPFLALTVDYGVILLKITNLPLSIFIDVLDSSYENNDYEWNEDGWLSVRDGYYWNGLHNSKDLA